MKESKKLSTDLMKLPEIDLILEIEKVKKEADQLMMKKLAEIEDLKNKIANLEESLKSRDYFEKPDYQYLIEENRRLEEEKNELLMDNKRLAAQVEDQINQLRKSGIL